MNKFQELDRIRQESIERMKTLSAGDPVTNICAGEDNPHRHAYFVKSNYKTTNSKYGVKHTDRLATCTDGKQKWNTDIDVVYPGHLSIEESSELWYAYADVHWG